MIDKMFCLHHTDLSERKNRLIPIFECNDMNVEWIESFHPSELFNKSGISTGELSLYLKHIYAYEQAKKQKWNFVLIMEDDADINTGFPAFLSLCMDEFIKLDADLMFLGTCCGIKPENIVQNKKVYYCASYTTRCTHCYVVRVQCIDSIIEGAALVNKPIDHKLNEVIINKGLRSCYVEPGISQFGFRSSLR